MLPESVLDRFVEKCPAAGMPGVNVWYGGPLDPRLDPPAVMVEADDSEAV